MVCASTNEKAAVAAMRKHLFGIQKDFLIPPKFAENSSVVTQSEVMVILKKYLFKENNDTK